MTSILMFGGLALLVLCLPVSIITTIVFAIKKKNILIPALCIPSSVVVGMAFILIGSSMYNQVNEQQTVEQAKWIETEEKQESESASEEEKIEVADEFAYRDMTVKYLKHEIVVDDIDQTVLVVYYDFTNNSDENKAFDFAFSDNCFQNGVEVEHSYWHVNDESKNSGKEVKSGTTITVASSFVLGDSRDDVELEITPWISNRVLFEKTLELE